jgi:glycosyltransferase involved in cell wall biosynthesis
MNILCVIDCLGSGGSQRQIVELALGFKEKGHTVTFLTYHDIPFYNPILLQEGIAIHCIGECNYLLRILRMRRFIRKGHYKGVLAFLEGPCFISEIAGIPFKKWKLAISEGSANPAIYKSVKHIIYRLFHVFADYVVANSHANMKIVRNINPFLRNAKCKVIYNLIDFRKWKPLENYIPRKDGLLKIIVVASHQYLKNLNGLIDAVSLLTPEERSRIRIHWYGDRIVEPYVDGSFPEGKKKVVELGLEQVIQFFPATNPIMPKMQEADALGLFSYYEGFPNVVGEAMACRKPILCSSVSDLPDMLSHDSNLLCKADDPISICSAIRYLLNIPTEKLIQLGYKNEELAKEAFEREKNMMAYLELLIS